MKIFTKFLSYIRLFQFYFKISSGNEDLIIFKVFGWRIKLIWRKKKKLWRNENWQFIVDAILVIPYAIVGY